MSKHTPGPWLIAGEDKTFVYALGPMETNKFWAHVQYAGPEKIGKEEATANAILIAAAPELLDALREVSQSLAWKEFGECRGFSDNFLSANEALEKSRSAIAKATGEQK